MKPAGWVACALLLNACVGGRVPVVGEAAPAAKDPSEEQSYRDTLARYTGHKEIYNGFDTRIFAAATLQSWKFRQARVRRTALFKAQTAEEVEAALAKERAEHDVGTEFFLGVHLNDKRYDDFDKKDTIWHLALVGAGGELAPTSVDRIGRSNLDMRALYPYMDDFWVAYRVKFPKLPAGDGPVVLRLASSLGQADLQVSGDP